MLIPVVLISILNIFIVMKLLGLEIFDFKGGSFCRKKTPNSSFHQSSNKSMRRSSSNTQRALFTNSYIESNKRVCLETRRSTPKTKILTESVRLTPEETKTTLRDMRGYMRGYSNTFTSKAHLDIMKISNIKKRQRRYSRTTLILLSVSSTYLLLYVYL
jgi:hypothetical protein